MYIVTHQSPDWDAIGGVWLLARYGDLGDTDARFVDTGAPDPEVLGGAWAVVDTGNEYDPVRLRFDHHQLPGREANDTCATLQILRYLTNGGDITHPLFFLNQIAALIFAGDTGKQTDGADWSRAVGIHALLSAQKARKQSDEQLLDWGFGILDLLAEASKARYEAQATLTTHTVYRSDDGLLVALKDAPQGATFAAMEAGARVVLFANYEEHAIGIMRAGEWQEPHCGRLVERACDIAEYDYAAGAFGYAAGAFGAGWGAVAYDAACAKEMRTWYLHEAGFFAGRGTKKAPRSDRVEVDVARVARMIDAAWER